MSIELPATSRHRRNMTERLLKELEAQVFDIWYIALYLTDLYKDLSNYSLGSKMALPRGACFTQTHIGKKKLLKIFLSETGRTRPLIFVM